MSTATAIGMVSESLRNLLVGEMLLRPAVKVTILAPDESGGDRRVNLFLYQVQENPAFKNMDWQLKPGSADTLIPPPLSLSLFYLMTPHAPNDAVTGNAGAHEILGDAMRVFHEHPVVPVEYLADELQGEREELRIIPQAANMDELGQIWSTFSQPFRLSVLYQISVVQIAPDPRRERALPERVRRIGVPTVAAPFSPPSIDALAPLRGPAGTAITIAGRNLAGWRAYVKIAGRTILDAAELAGDRWSVTLPAGLAPGFHQVQVDVAHLCRRTFFFEVTP